MSLFEKFVIAGNEKGGRVGKRWTMLDEGEMAQIRASVVQQKRQEVKTALRYAAGFDCLVEEWHDCGVLKPRTQEK